MRETAKRPTGTLEELQRSTAQVTAVSWISLQFATWFPADFKYSRKPIQTNSSWQHSGSSSEKSCNEPCSPFTVLATPSAHTSDILTSWKSLTSRKIVNLAPVHHLWAVLLTPRCYDLLGGSSTFNLGKI
ncbi:hypothetical protein ATANTOWER_014996 [Ataeniobius toweri]|uniref:Uncharacterized protein n=1 Tax=Ataeniobius toweri TaxID=208326 RepID=A0ABU7AHG1_9TELE|nr:hypothetical protein [Ataeniobius toweri]